MKQIILVISVLGLVGCGKCSGPAQDQAVFIKMPTKKLSGPTPWVLYAPTVSTGGLPADSQQGYYFQSLLDAGIAVVGIDTGESYGSPEARKQIARFIDSLPGRGLARRGCAIAQSRGGLQVYGLIADHPGLIACVAGIYPLLSLDDYVGAAGMASAWGMTPDEMRSRPALSPHNRIAEISSRPLSVLHLHGDADNVVSYQIDADFIAGLKSHGVNADLIKVPGQGHEMYTVEFFKNKLLLDFLVKNAKKNAELN